MIEGFVELARLHAPLLSIAALIVGAAFCVIAPGPRAGWGVALCTTLLAAVIATDHAVRVLLLDAPSVVAMEGVAFAGDRIGAFAAAVLSICALLAAAGAGASLRVYAPRSEALSLALLLLSAAGWISALYAANVLAFVLAAEIAWLATIGLVAMGAERRRTALNAGLRMMGAGAAGASFSLLGAMLVLSASGVQDFVSLSETLRFDAQPFSLGLALIVASLALKAGVAPFHLWVGAAFSRANEATVFALGGVGLAGALMAMVRVLSYGVAAPEFGAAAFFALAPLGMACVVIGSAQAIGARDLRRLIAYALTAQTGGVLLCVSLGSPAGFAAALVQITAIAGAALILFGGAGVSESYKIDDINGLARRAPIAAMALTLGAASLIGAPLTIGFLGRWRLVEAGVGVDWWWPVAAMTVASLAAVFYGGQLIERVYFRRAQAVQTRSGDPWRFAAFPALAAGLLIIGLGLAPQLLLQAADAATMVAP